MNEKNENIFKTMLTAVLIIFAISALIIGGIIFIITYQPHYTWFTEKRKEKMEEKFSITVTDNIDLREYRQLEFLTQLDYTLYLYTDDLEKFMEENINGTITEKYDGDSFGYKGKDGQAVVADVFKNDSKENYSITLNIID